MKRLNTLLICLIVVFSFACNNKNNNKEARYLKTDEHKIIKESGSLKRDKNFGKVELNYSTFSSNDKKVAEGLNKTVNNFILTPVFRDISFSSPDEMAGKYIKEFEKLSDMNKDSGMRWKLERNNEVLYQNDKIISMRNLEILQVSEDNILMDIEYLTYIFESNSVLTIETLVDSSSLSDFTNVINERFCEIHGFNKGGDLSKKGFLFKDGKFFVSENFAITEDRFIVYYEHSDITPGLDGSTKLSINLPVVIPFFKKDVVIF